MKLSVRFFILSIIIIVFSFWLGQSLWIKIDEYVHKDESRFASFFGFVPLNEYMKENRTGCVPNVRIILKKAEKTADFKEICRLAVKFGFTNEVLEVVGPG